MEQGKNKRAREDGEFEVESSYKNNKNAKKRDIYGKSLSKEKKEEEEEEKAYFKALDSNNLAQGVFDFPWLKEGVISKSEECFFDFKDDLFSSLESQESSFKDVGIDFSEECGLCDTPKASKAHIEEGKLMEDLLKPFESNGLELEAEDLDCIWSFLFNMPL